MDAVSALNVIAVAVAVQTVLLVAGAVAAVVAYRHLSTELQRQVVAIEARVDALLETARQSAATFSGVSREASNLLTRVGEVTRSVAALAFLPRALITAGAASGAARLLAAWRRPAPRASRDSTGRTRGGHDNV